MKTVSRILALIACLCCLAAGNAQKALPDFSVRELTKGKVQVSWENPYPSCIQLAIQRSPDSTRNFRTIFSSQSPELPSNGFLDSKFQPGTTLYYRIFYVLKGGDYYFSKTQKVITTPLAVKPAIIPIPVPPIVKTTTPPKDRTRIFLKKTVIFNFTSEEYKRFKDSINTQTKDALHRLNDHAVEWRPAKPKMIKRDYTFIYMPDGSGKELSNALYKKFKDSVFSKTKDTLTRINEWQVKFSPFVAKAEETVTVYFSNETTITLSKEAFKKFKDSIATHTRDTLFTVNKTGFALHPFILKPKEYISIYKNDSLVVKLESGNYKRFRDSVTIKTKDTLFPVDKTRTDIHVFVPKYVWKPSAYVFTNAQGYVSIVLPLVKQHRYHLVIYEEDGSELFRIKSIKEPELVLDKTNFIHAGWFGFELFEDDKLKEKSKFQLSKD